MENIINRNICRICFKEQDISFPLFVERSDCSWSPYDQLVDKTKLKIGIDDGGPTSICLQCLRDLETTVNFLEKCEKSNQILTSLYPSCVATTESKLDLKDVIDSSENYSEVVECKNADQSKSEVVSCELNKGISIEEEMENALRCPECGSGRRCRHWAPPSTHTCPQCHKVFTRKFNFKLHLKRHRGEREFPCARCGRRQLTRGQARRHCGPRARRACPRPGCRSTFTSAANLHTHLRAHDGERPFVCGECGKGFTSKNILNDHLRIHTGVKPYMCAECGAQFTTNKLAAHVRTHRVPRPPRAARAPAAAAGPAPHACRWCAARYRHTQSLNKHVRRHHQNLVESKASVENGQ
ncbi:gastrula zinc finger protein XlCGF52.1-like [Galleria mellonella]|uniref:Gastrula zinc finger protein XlCGF52.1-like n=1 Tax=Galleria mellonella TaxID=7137 RepID=A0A6J1WI02_GALME|nr:gastrula zinc finger protein XlCGF52.1-like [Galleria mellonella]